MKFDDNGWLYLGIQKNLIHTISGIETCIHRMHKLNMNTNYLQTQYESPVSVGRKLPIEFKSA